MRPGAFLVLLLIFFPVSALADGVLPRGWQLTYRDASDTTRVRVLTFDELLIQTTLAGPDSSFAVTVLRATWSVDPVVAGLEWFFQESDSTQASTNQISFVGFRRAGLEGALLDEQRELLPQLWVPDASGLVADNNWNWTGIIPDNNGTNASVDFLVELQESIVVPVWPGGVSTWRIRSEQTVISGNQGAAQFDVWGRDLRHASNTSGRSGSMGNTFRGPAVIVDERWFGRANESVCLPYRINEFVLLSATDLAMQPVVTTPMSMGRFRSRFTPR